MSDDKKETPAVEKKQQPVRMSVSQPLLQGAIDILQTLPFSQVADVLLALQKDIKVSTGDK